MPRPVAKVPSPARYLSLGLLLVASGCLVEEEPAGPSAAAPAAPPAPLVDQIRTAYEGRTQPESVRMLLAIADGEPLGPRMGWFGPGQSARSWSWLAARYDLPADGALTLDRFDGKSEWFAALDRDGDGRVTRADFDWRFAAPADDETDEHVPAGLRGLMAGVGKARPDLPPKEELLRLFFDGEIGSMNEGPRVGDRAPDFALETDDRSETVRLSDLTGERPVVLLFGSFTCDAFRGRLKEVEAIRRRFADDARFLAVYVREAHPDDGWMKDVNLMQGVSVNQPKTFDGRVDVARRCRDALPASFPLVVDGMSDPTAQAYSAFPTRLYVIGRDGTVAFKGGRGPVGFLPREMEQALVLTLLDRAGEPTGASE